MYVRTMTVNLNATGIDRVRSIGVPCKGNYTSASLGGVDPSIKEIVGKLEHVDDREFDGFEDVNEEVDEGLEVDVSREKLDRYLGSVNSDLPRY